MEAKTLKTVQGLVFVMVRSGFDSRRVRFIVRCSTHLDFGAGITVDGATALSNTAISARLIIPQPTPR